MGLRNRFILLMAGIVLVPLVTLPLTLLVVQLVMPGWNDPLLKPQIVGARLLKSQFIESIAKQDYSDLDKGLAGGSLLIEDVQSNIVIHASPLGADAVLDPNSMDSLVMILNIQDHTYRITLRSQAVGPAYQNAFLLPFVPVLAMAAMLLFIMAMSLHILRGLQRSVKNLDYATREIAGGNLDFDLKIDHHDALVSLARAMEEMRQKLKEEYARRDRFIMAVSHDLKTPIAVIEAYLDAFDDGFANSREMQAQFLATIRDKTNILGHRISHLVELAKMTTVEWRHTLIATDFSIFMTERLQLIAEESAVMGRHLVLDLQHVPGVVLKMNADMISRVLENLIANAQSYSPDDGTALVVQTWNTQDKLFISVQNHGPGIKPEFRDLIFEPFFRADAGRNSRGFGLGLASVKSIIETHGWSIQVDSTPGQLTVFTIIIPICR